MTTATTYVPRHAADPERDRERHLAQLREDVLATNVSAACAEAAADELITRLLTPEFEAPEYARCTCGHESYWHDWGYGACHRINGGVECPCPSFDVAMAAAS